MNLKKFYHYSYYDNYLFEPDIDDFTEAFPRNRRQKGNE